MNEIDATFKVLNKLGTFHSGSTTPDGEVEKFWWIPISTNSIDKVRVVCVDGAFGFSDRGHIDRKRSGFEMIEALADNFPYVAKKLAEPME